MLSMPTSVARLVAHGRHRPRPYHHGNLRAALLARAERALREGGVASCRCASSRARSASATRAPRRHFADKQALLDALAAGRLRAPRRELRAAIDGAGADFDARLAALAARLRALRHRATPRCSS